MRLIFVGSCDLNNYVISHFHWGKIIVCELKAVSLYISALCLEHGWLIQLKETNVTEALGSCIINSLLGINKIKGHA